MSLLCWFVNSTVLVKLRFFCSLFLWEKVSLRLTERSNKWKLFHSAVPAPPSWLPGWQAGLRCQLQSSAKILFCSGRISKQFLCMFHNSFYHLFYPPLEFVDGETGLVAAVGGAGYDGDLHGAVSSKCQVKLRGIMSTCPLPERASRPWSHHSARLLLRCPPGSSAACPVLRRGI